MDTDKYQGDLISAPLVPQAGQTQIDAMNVELTSIGLTDGQKTTSLDTNVHLAILDSGTSLIVMPTAVADMFVKEMGGVTIRGSSFVACNVETATATFDFQFGGSNGPKVSVPVSEMVQPQVENQTFDDKTPACALGIQSQDQDFLVLGDVFLRSAYVVYNLESQTVALANAKFNVTTSNIKAINSDIPGLKGPGGTSVTYSATATPSASDILGPLLGTQSAALSATSAISIVPGKPSFTVAGGSGGGSGGGQKSEGAHVYANPVLPMSYVAVSLVTIMGMMLGGAVIHRL